ncbi:putative toxin-antitoxin system, toxin component, RelE/ParE-like [Desulfonema limicola]|uniref:Toxin-antitoxin system, toxin component, RelE/ParE-like n=1 Tax=Desulfonema limicola TaxID=45656 RepID=A0A975B8D6_9BACT|nr:type II toxin-antitoxin system RelE/ParE family toxin [Desulfonema limicola]QTA80677.1 putative toxin-antitoxin system, toxin component, RelE/ParE-like [Desulfonema limicola]
MKIKFESSFGKDLKKIKEPKLLQRVKSIIEEIKEHDGAICINNLKKMKGYETFYRIKIGDYRIGLEIIKDQAIITRILHRKDIYRYFP